MVQIYYHLLIKIVNHGYFNAQLIQLEMDVKLKHVQTMDLMLLHLTIQIVLIG